ncbi:MAG: PAS domain S-box protein [Magnetococcales bacterium]|nr:PAS domain S-box protein [Magnetococcales bacterium]
MLKLRRSEAILRSIIDTAVSGIVTIDQTGQIILFNPAAERMFGYHTAEVTGKNVTILMPSPYREEHDRYLKNFLETGTHKIIGIGREVTGRKKNGDIFPIDLAVSKVDLDDVILFVGIITDATQRKSAEASLLAAKHSAESADRFKSEFLATMSHEIRTPMHAILGFLHLILQTELNDKQRDYLLKIKNSSINLMVIINDILDLSKIGAGKMILETTDFYIDDVLTHVTNVVGIQAKEKGLALFLERHPDVPDTMIGDPTRLGQILVNMTNNAVKFTETGEINVSIQTMAFRDHRVQLLFRVRDTGIGMTPEQCATLFQSFTQGDVSTTRRYGGSGLGLSICKRLVEMMAGEIDVVSQAGRGSVFSFTVWLGVPSEQQDQDLRQLGDTGDKHEQSSVVNPAWNLSGVTILVAEDAVINQEIVTEVLGRVGMIVTVAGDGAAAVRQVQERGFDIILMDIHLPIMDGITATRHIRALPHGKKIPILAMTASALETDRDKCLEAGMNDFITKPIEPDKLLEVLHPWFPGRENQAVILQGIDLEVGLKRVGGRIILLRKLWKRFLEEYGQKHDRIREALGQKDRETALRFVHTLKGVSGSVGAIELQQSAIMLESALRDSDNWERNFSLLARLEKDLSHVTEGIENYFSWYAMQPQPQTHFPATNESVFSLLDELILMVQEMDPLAEEKAELLVGCFNGGPGCDLAKKLAIKISNAEFEESFAILQELAKIAVVDS